MSCRFASCYQSFFNRSLACLAFKALCKSSRIDFPNLGQLFYQEFCSLHASRPVRRCSEAEKVLQRTQHSLNSVRRGQRQTNKRLTNPSNLLTSSKPAPSTTTTTPHAPLVQPRNVHTFSLNPLHPTRKAFRKRWSAQKTGTTHTFAQDVRGSMAVPARGADKRRQPVPAGLLHHHVQRFGVVSSHLSACRRPRVPCAWALFCWTQVFSRYTACESSTGTNGNVT